MALLSIRTKQKIGAVGEVLGWIFVLVLVLGPWITGSLGVAPHSLAASCGNSPEHTGMGAQVAHTVSAGTGSS